MKAATLVFLIASLLAGCASAPPLTTLAQGQSGTISFQSLTFPGHLWTPLMPLPAEGRLTTVSGALTLPPGAASVPAVILTHGCAGITGAETDWATTLNGLGIATFVVDSFGGRNISEICTGRHSVNIASVLTDVYRVLTLLATHPRIDSSHIAIMGLSFGGRTALWASQTRFQERYGQGLLRFAAHLAFYPTSCYIRLADEDRIDGGPIRIFHGAADDWIPIGPCKEYVGRLRRAGKDAALLEYADAHHSFDNPRSPRRTWPDALSPRNCAFAEQDGKIVDPTTGRVAGIDAPCVSRGVSLGYNPEAHRRAVQDVQNFLKTLFRLKSGSPLGQDERMRRAA
ncbi:MAG: dienelactone hydrolase family protein [Candidatus Rokuibacteriota bacterium]